MIRLPGPLGSSLRLVLRFPLHLVAAGLAAVLSEFLFTLQPLFLRGFIDQAQGGLPRSRLWLFPAFMAAGAVLAYAFDFIAVAIRYRLSTALSRGLKEAYMDAAPAGKEEAARFSLRAGLGGFAELALSLALDFWLAGARLLLILGAMALGQPALAAAAAATMAAGYGLGWLAMRRIGRLSRMLDLLNERIASLALRGPAGTSSALDRFYRLDAARFNLRSASFMVSFFLFRILPVSVLAWYLLGQGPSLGTLASTFLYFSMLQGPYSELARLAQESAVALSESALFGPELERGLARRELFARVPVGLVWNRSGPETLGAIPLSKASDGPAGREFQDDLPPLADCSRDQRLRKEELLARLARVSRKRSVCLVSADPQAGAFAHFILDPGGRLDAALGA